MTVPASMATPGGRRRFVPENAGAQSGVWASSATAVGGPLPSVQCQLRACGGREASLYDAEIYDAYEARILLTLGNATARQYPCPGFFAKKSWW